MPNALCIYRKEDVYGNHREYWYGFVCCSAGGRDDALRGLELRRGLRQREDAEEEGNGEGSNLRKAVHLLPVVSGASLPIFPGEKQPRGHCFGHDISTFALQQIVMSDSRRALVTI
jgi:hypothetical protein